MVEWILIVMEIRDLYTEYQYTLIDGFDSSRPFNSLFDTPSAILVPSAIINGIFIVAGSDAISTLSSDFRFLASFPLGVGARCELEAIDDLLAGREFESF